MVYAINVTVDKIYEHFADCISFMAWINTPKFNWLTSFFTLFKDLIDKCCNID